jgi:hypothetical protein
LNTSTGVISGTPTALSALANYTVTATNASGSTTATISLVVNSAAPSISYSSTLFTLTTGVPAQGVTPSNSGGPVVAWSISPATLPVGLTFSSTTGSIGGTPTVATAPAPYAVTAENSGGKSTASLTLGVQAVLLDLVHNGPITLLLLGPSRVLSVGPEYAFNRSLNPRWVLWNYTTAGILARGTLGCWTSTCTDAPHPYVDLEGLTMVDETGAGLEVRSSADGSVLSVLSTPVAWWKLASDGSYICAGSTTALTVWSPTGTVIATRAGDYSTAVVFAAPSHVQVALGPAGTNTVETVVLPSGTSSVGAPFQGQFNTWFLDGQQFLTNVGNTVWVYTKDTVQKDLMTLPSTNLPSTGNLAGTRSWFWAYPGSSGQPSGPLMIYQVGNSSSPTARYPLTYGTAVVPSGATIGLLPLGSASSVITVIDLSGSTPASTNYVSPLGPAEAYSFLSASQWMLGTPGGVLIDGASLVGAPRYFDYGAPWAVAGSASRVAVGTAVGQIVYLDAATGALEGTINFRGPIDNNPGKLALSSDGTVLAAFAVGPNTLTIYSLPSGTPLKSYTYAATCAATAPTCLWDFTLSASGSVLGQVTGTYDGTNWACSRQVTAVMGGPVLWSDTTTGGGWEANGAPCTVVPIRLSADGTEVAVSNYKFNRPNQGTTNIYKNGTLVTAVPGWTVGWLDADRILVNNYGTFAGDPAVNYLGASIYNSSGMKLADLTYPHLLPELDTFDVVSVDSVYGPALNAIYSLTNGTPIWTSASPILYNSGAIAGSNVVFASGHEIVSQPY